MIIVIISIITDKETLENTSDIKNAAVCSSFQQRRPELGSVAAVPRKGSHVSC